MKRLFWGLLLSLSLVTVAALAKDGPFPMFQAVGTWQSKAQNLELQISITRFVDRNNVQVRVVARSINPQAILASGFVVQDLRSKDFVADLIGVNGEKMRLTLLPEYKVQSNMNKRVLELKMEMIRLDTGTHSSLPGALEKTSF